MANSMEWLLLTAFFFVVVAIDYVIWVVCFDIARHRTSSFGKAAMRSIAISAIFSPGMLVGGHGCLPVPAFIGFVIHTVQGDGHVMAFDAFLLLVVFLISLFIMLIFREKPSQSNPPGSEW